MNPVSLLTALLTFLIALPSFAESNSTPDRIQIGVSTAFTGDAATFGLDIKNAFTLMNDLQGGGRYELLFEDDKCDNPTAVSVAQKFINIDKVKYVLGFPCNSTVLATAPIYEKAGVFVLTTSGNSGDVLDIGKNNFRLFPSDAGGATVLYEYMIKRHKKVAIITEQTEYPVLMERTIKRENSARGQPLEIVSEEFVHGETDLRTVLLKLASKKVEAIFVNANTDNSFIPLVNQIRTIRFSGALYSAYLPASSVVLKALGSSANGFVFANLPTSDQMLTDKGKEIMKKFKERFGEPQSGFPVVPTSLEAFRIFDLALQGGKTPTEYLNSTKFSGGFISDYYFDEHGAVQGINFQMQKIVDGKVVVLND